MHKRLALAAAIMGSFVAGLDSTVVNVALPAIRGDLGGGLAGQQWVSNAYLLTLGALILVAGSLADLYGERRVFSIGVGGFGVVSLLCAVAPSIEVLIAGRALQGVFGALLTPSALAVIVSTFGPEERGAAIGSWTAWSGISFVIGPLAGGWLVDTASWRWIFAINVPFVAVTLVLVAMAVPASRGRPGVRLDWLGAVLTVLGLAGPVLALIRQPIAGWGSVEVWLPGLGGLALLALFVVHERRTSAPMLPLELFRRRNFVFGNLQTFSMYGGLGAMMFFLTLFLQQVAGYEALEAGVAMIPTTIVMFALSRRAGRLADRYGPRFFMGCGPLVGAVGVALMLRVDEDVAYWTDLFPALLLFSLGLVATVTPLTATVLADADEHNAGIASGVNNAIARVASLVAVAAIGAVVAAVYSGDLGGDAARETLAIIPGVPESVDASVHAFHVGIAICAALLAVGGVLGLAGIRNPRREVRCEDCAEGAHGLHATLEHDPLAGAPRAHAGRRVSA
ncbi:MAG TPA: MFS transporter [Solirubrobacter sp.]|nr:MFS transporter [Solirubrobacter sp.]